MTLTYWHFLAVAFLSTLFGLSPSSAVVQPNSGTHSLTQRPVAGARATSQAIERIIEMELPENLGEIPKGMTPAARKAFIEDDKIAATEFKALIRAAAALNKG